MNRPVTEKIRQQTIFFQTRMTDTCRTFYDGVMCQISYKNIYLNGSTVGTVKSKVLTKQFCRINNINELKQLIDRQND